MRSSQLAMLVTTALLGAACLAPTAAAAPTTLSFDAPSSTPANSTVTVGVTLRIAQFLCHEPHTITVALTTANTDGVRAVFQQSTLSYTIPARSYFAEDYEQTQTVNLTVRAISGGTITLGASMAADVGPCFVPGGFDPANATAELAVDAPALPATTPTNETNTSANATTETPPTPKATPKAPATRAPSCGPDGGCGRIGDYEAPLESSNDTPSASLLAVMGVVALAALVARRRRNK